MSGGIFGMTEYGDSPKIDVDAIYGEGGGVSTSDGGADGSAVAAKIVESMLVSPPPRQQQYVAPPPPLVKAGMSTASMLLLGGAAVAVAALLFVVISKKKPEHAVANGTCKVCGARFKAGTTCRCGTRHPKRARKKKPIRVTPWMRAMRAR